MFKSITAFVVASLLLLSTTAQGGLGEHITKHGKKYKWLAIGAATVIAYKHYCNRSVRKHYCHQGEKKETPKLKQPPRKKECHKPGCRRN